jgi:mono/diheme cytochrome c family protein
MRIGKALAAAALCATLAPAAAGDSPGTPALGTTPNAHTLATRDTLVFPDGRGLPPGSGTVAMGRDLFARQCVACHGEGGRGGPGGELAGGDPDLTRDQPDKTIGTYWPYATTLFDFIRRSMPLNAPRSLDNDHVYALVAYLLDVNGIEVPAATLDAAKLAAVKMPNRDGFRWVDVTPPDQAD